MRRARMVGAVLLLCTAACDRDAAPRPATADLPGAAATGASTAPPGSGSPGSGSPGSGSPDPGIERIPGGARIVAVGDLHGDIDATRAVLRLAGVIDAEDHWSGGADTLVQTGDQLDRGDDEPEILDLLARLVTEADKAGGKAVVLNGNHETMNVLLDFRYVTPGGFQDYQGEAAAPNLAPSVRAALDRIDPSTRGRAAAFIPGGRLARRLAQQSIVALVGDSVFVHGGVLPEHVRYGLDRLNRESSAWMRGEGAPPELMQAENAPVWSRAYSAERGTSAQECAMLDQTLKLLGAKRMVVGHTPQKSGITEACGEKVWRIDVGLAKHYGGSPEALEIRGDKVRVLKP